MPRRDNPAKTPRSSADALSLASTWRKPPPIGGRYFWLLTPAPREESHERAGKPATCWLCWQSAANCSPLVQFPDHGEIEGISSVLGPFACSTSENTISSSWNSLMAEKGIFSEQKGRICNRQVGTTSEFIQRADIPNSIADRHRAPHSLPRRSVIGSGTLFANDNDRPRIQSADLARSCECDGKLQ